ncbi:MAG: flagellar hook-associated protein FlgK [Bacillota bacterium]|nr:flagellar hook-associated protein FlgK [Bacillota bacterium]
MSQGFLGLNIALSGLFANQRNLGIISHNVANAHTEGYSRQLMNTKAYRPQNLVGGKGTIGTGVDITAIKQVRDSYLDYKTRYETSLKHEWEARAKVLSEIEGTFNEPSDSSIAKLLDSYYESINTLAKNPENQTARTLVRQNIIGLSEGVRRISTALKAVQKDLNFQFRSAVKEVNGLAEQIRDLNEAIHKAELEGGRANDMRDQRNLLVDKLSEYVKVDYYEDEQKRFYVLVGGQQLVAHYRADSFRMIPREKPINDDDSHGIYDIEWQNGNPIFLESGKVKGLRDVRDNVSGDFKGIPYYIDKLNDFVSTFTQDFNEIHAGGYGLDKSTDLFMFTTKNRSSAEFRDYLINSGYNGTKAIEVTEAVQKGLAGVSDKEKAHRIRQNIQDILAQNPDYAKKTIFKLDGNYYVVDKIRADELSMASDLEDLNKLAASNSIDDLVGNGKNMLKLIETRHQVDMYDWGAPEDYVKSLVSNLGVDAREAYRIAENQAMLVKDYGRNRDSIMGVSLDEEMSNMIKYQTAYAANARMVNVFDEMLDLLVNRLGLVGR